MYKNLDPIEYDIDAIKQDAERLTRENAGEILPPLWIEVNRLMKNIKIEEPKKEEK